MRDNPFFWIREQEQKNVLFDFFFFLLFKNTISEREEKKAQEEFLKSSQILCLNNYDIIKTYCTKWTNKANRIS